MKNEFGEKKQHAESRHQDGHTLCGRNSGTVGWEDELNVLPRHEEAYVDCGTCRRILDK